MNSQQSYQHVQDPSKLKTNKNLNKEGGGAWVSYPQLKSQW